MSSYVPKAHALLRECLTLATSERVAFLDERCAGDPELRQELESLLVQHDTQGGILDRGLDHSELGFPIPERPVEPARALEGQSVGPYHVLEFLGHGGMGAVYLAEQSEPVRRRIALKILRDPAGGRLILARFAAERQALALMDHPHIARIFDAAVAEDGRPYFTMEYVPGVPLLEFCEQQNLDLDATLRLFRAVCAGVQHAHQKGVIHRDLKPSNILVTVRGGTPVPKIIDFGVAKALHQPLTDLTLHTAHGHLIGTPAYMSPEQCLGDGRDIDTRADVYSLGVLLYEMLSGVVPISLEGTGTASVAEFQRMLLEEEPTPVSVRIQRDPASQEALRRRGQDPPRWSRRCRRELDWIVQKAMAKERTRRYDTASGLAADVLRYLERDPVSAGPPGLTYRFRAVARRHRALIISGIAMIAVSLAAAAVSVGFALQSNQDRRAALAAQADAVRLRQNAELSEREAQRAGLAMRGALEYFVDLMEQAVPQAGGTESLTVRDAVRKASTNIDSMLVNVPDVGSVIATTIAQFEMMMNERNHVEARLRLALEHFRQNPELALEEYGSAAKLLGLVERDSLNLNEASALFDESYRAYSRLDPQYLDLPLVRDLQASVLVLQGQEASALALRLSILDQFPDPTPAMAPNVAYVHNKIASQLQARGDLAGAERHLRKSLDLVSALPDNAYFLGTAWARLGSLAKERGNHREALDWFQRARSAVGLNPVNPFAQDLTQDIAEAQIEVGDLEAAAAELRGLDALQVPGGSEPARTAPLWDELEARRKKQGID